MEFSDKIDFLKGKSNNNEKGFKDMSQLSGLYPNIWSTVTIVFGVLPFNVDI